MFRVGLTGGIASGKSTAASYFADLGVTVISLDQISREVVAKGTGALKKIRSHFGEEAISSDGNLNRDALRKIIFVDPKKRQWLEDLLHPLIRDRQEHLIADSASTYVVIEVPLLTENQLHENFDRVLVVDSEKENQIDRGTERDNAAVSDIEKILASQASREDRLRIADDVIENNGSLDELKAKVLELNHLYQTLAASCYNARF